MPPSVSTAKLTCRQVFLFWLPLAVTWCLMTSEMTFTSALAARRQDSQVNLAALGVALSLVYIIESPIFSILSAANALVRDWPSYLKLRNFTYGLSGALSGVVAVVFLPPVFEFIGLRLMRLPPEVAETARAAAAWGVTVPFAVAYRRFFQGLLISGNRSALVGLGTVLRFAVMVVVGLALFRFAALSGAQIGIGCWVAGILAEAVAARMMAAPIVRKLRAAQGCDEPISYGAIVKFYTPLAINTAISSASAPVFTFFLAQAPRPLESLAVFPVINGAMNIFSSLCMALHETIIAKAAAGRRALPALRRFARGLGGFVFLSLAALVYTPLFGVWFESISALSPELAEFARAGAGAGLLLPLCGLIGLWQRAFLLSARDTAPISYASVIELGGAALIMLAVKDFLPCAGVVSAYLALTCGRIAAVCFLIGPSKRATAVLTE